MTKVTRRDYVLTAVGHAGFSAAGTDIVCAAASALFYTLARELDYRHIEFTMTEDAATGAEIVAYPPDGFTLDTDVAFETICTGYRMLAEEYPEHVTFTDES